MKKIVSTVFLVIVSVCSFAQGGFPPPPPPPGGGPQCWPPPCVPIDNGISFLILAGIILAVYKLLKKKNIHFKEIVKSKFNRSNSN